MITAATDAPGPLHADLSLGALHPDVVVVVAALAGFYLWALTRRRAAVDAPRATSSEKSAVVAGIALLWVVSDGPVHEVAEGASYAVHMTQHVVLGFVVPPLLLLGTPVWLLRWMVRPALPVVRVLTRTVVALITFNAVAAFTHWPKLVTLSVESEPAHFGQHALLVGAALTMFSPVIGRLSELPSLPPLFAMVYLFLQSLLPTVPASWLAFAEHPPYHVYEALPKIWGLTAATDQQLAGAIMKVGGGLILWTGIGVIFFRWAARERGGVGSLAAVATGDRVPAAVE